MKTIVCIMYCKDGVSCHTCLDYRTDHYTIFDDDTQLTEFKCGNCCIGLIRPNYTHWIEYWKSEYYIYAMIDINYARHIVTSYTGTVIGEIIKDNITLQKL